MDEHEVHSKIAGVTFPCPKTGVPRQEIIRRYVWAEMSLTPVPEPNNPYSKTGKAVGLQVKANDGVVYHVGYLNEKVSPVVFDAIRSRKPASVVVTEVTGGSTHKNTLGVNILVRWTGRPLEDESDEEPEPAKKQKSKRVDNRKKKGGCGATVLMMGAVLVMGWVCVRS